MHQQLSNLPIGTPPELVAAIADYTRDIFDRHGMSAFIAPREAAVAHEVGHAIVGAHEGFSIREITLYSRTVAHYGVTWGGRCMEVSSTWTSGPDSSADDDLKRARFIIAGLAGETLTGLNKPGSSLEEEALSQLIGHHATKKLAYDRMSHAEYPAYAKQFWDTQVWGVAVAILRANREPFNRLAYYLQRKDHLHGGKLHKVLAQVTRIAS
jgi:hypothetical protein